VFLFFVLITKAQVILPTTETAFERQHNFNPDFIKAKGIKRINLEIIDKKDFEVAVDKNLLETYEFNSDGYLTRYYYTSIVRTVEREITLKGLRGRNVTRTITDYVYDTISTSYFYAGRNLMLRRHHDGLNYYESRYYRYDSLNRLTKEMRFKETNNSLDKSVFILGHQLLLSEDSFQYQKYSSGQVKCTFLNNENRPYKQQITNVDSLGRKININENYTAAGWIMQSTKFNSNNKLVLKNTYEFDEQQELYSEKQYKNDVLLKEISYVTDKTDSLLNSIIVRDSLNKSLRIIKLKYDTGQVSKGSE
jgi:hypothetical protein